MDPLSGQVLGRRELRYRDLSVPAAVKSKSSTIIYDDELGDSPPLVYIIHFQPSDLLEETTHSSGEGRYLVENRDAFVSKFVYYLLFIVTLYV